MATQTPIELMLDAMNKQRSEVYAHLKQIDKIIKGLKAGDLSLLNGASINTTNNNQNGEHFIEHIKESDNGEKTTTWKGDAKIIILKVFDSIGEACKLRQVQEEYANLTGTNMSIRESVRTLNKARKLKLMREIGADRGMYWVKTEWVEDGALLDEYKPDGFDLLYNANSLEYK